VALRAPPAPSAVVPGSAFALGLAGWWSACAARLYRAET